MRKNEPTNSPTCPDRPAFPYDPTPTARAFPGQPDDLLDLVNQYGTYNIQPTANSDTPYPAIAQGLAKDAPLPPPQSNP